MSKEIFLDKVKALVAARGEDYGPPDWDHKRVADYWSLHMRNVHGTVCELTALDVQMMIMMIKMVRLETTPTHMDSLLDIAGYAACAGECLQASNKPFSGSWNEGLSKALETANKIVAGVEDD